MYKRPSQENKSAKAEVEQNNLKMSNTELVSCIIPTYKRSETLLRAVNSALKQSYPNIEVLVVDDNEPNDEYSLNVQQVLKSVEDSRLKYIQQKKHINGAVARNVGIKAANGEYVAFLDDDDEWLPAKIERQVDFIKTSGVDATACYYTLYKKGELDRRGPKYNDDNLITDILSRSIQVMAGSCFICKKKCIVQSGMFDESLLRHQDLQMLVDFLNKSSMKVLKEYLVIIHEDSTKNQPTTEALIDIKRTFFKSMKPRMKQLSKDERKRIYDAHYFEIVVRAVREWKIYIAFKYLAKIGFSSQAYRDVYERYKSRKNV